MNSPTKAERLRANGMVTQAIRKGLLVRPARCAECGAGGKIYGHHDDYSRPLDVRWLCTTCHGAAHGRVDRSTTGMMLRALRQAKGLTQAQLAEAVHTSFETVCRWESGRIGMRNTSRLAVLHVLRTAGQGTVKAVAQGSR